jgi:hypothetical protein
MATVVEDVAARLRAQVPSRTVFEWALPDGVLPPAYLLVRATPTAESGARMPDTVDHEDWTVRVLSVAKNADPHVAARTADAGATFARRALRNYRPLSGQWRLLFDLGADAYPDDVASSTAYTAPLQYSLRDNV